MQGPQCAFSLNTTVVFYKVDQCAKTYGHVFYLPRTDKHGYNLEQNISTEIDLEASTIFAIFISAFKK